VAEGGRAQLEAALGELTQASHGLAEVLYRRTAANGAEAGPGAAGAAPKTDDVVDAEVVDEKK
jgi:hypothetical protein